MIKFDSEPEPVTVSQSRTEAIMITSASDYYTDHCRPRSQTVTVPPVWGHHRRLAAGCGLQVAHAAAGARRRAGRARDT